MVTSQSHHLTIITRDQEPSRAHSAKNLGHLWKMWHVGIKAIRSKSQNPAKTFRTCQVSTALWPQWGDPPSRSRTVTRTEGIEVAVRRTKGVSSVCTRKCVFVAVSSCPVLPTFRLSLAGCLWLHNFHGSGKSKSQDYNKFGCNYWSTYLLQASNSKSTKSSPVQQQNSQPTTNFHVVIHFL